MAKPDTSQTQGDDTENGGSKRKEGAVGRLKRYRGWLEPRYSSRGQLIPVWRWPLLRIKPQFLESVIYLYPSVKDAKRGKPAGGSGFLVGVQSTVAQDAGYLYAVTNKHVVENAQSRTIRLNTKAGGIDTLETDINDWKRPSGDDLAVLFLPISDAYFQFSFIPE